MTLAEVCEPLFLYICRLNRLARKGGEQDADQVRTELESENKPHLSEFLENWQG